MMTQHPLFLLLTAWALLAGGIGCTTSRVIENTRVPEIVIDEHGKITFNNKPVEVRKLAAAIKAAGFEKTQEVNILIPEKADRALMRAVSSELVLKGYTRTIFVKNRKAYSAVPENK